MGEPRRRLALAVALAAGVAARPAPGCEGHAFLRATLDPPPPELAGMRVEVHQTQGAQVVFENRTAHTVEVLDDAGDAFIRIGPGGVEANVASPSWYTTFAPAAIIPASAVAAAPPRWTRAASEPAFGWFDARVDPAHVPLPPELLVKPHPADLGSWAMPLRVDGVAVALRGRFRYDPPSGRAAVRLDSAAVPAPGVRVTVLPGERPGLLVANHGNEGLTIIGVDGEPFLRIDREGVRANVNSRTWRDSGRAGTRAAAAIDGGGPAWQRVASVPRYSWIDARTALALGARDGAVHRWTVPMQLGDRALAITGSTRWLEGAAPAARRDAEPSRAALNAR